MVFSASDCHLWYCQVWQLFSQCRLWSYAQDCNSSFPLACRGSVPLQHSSFIPDAFTCRLFLFPCACFWFLCFLVVSTVLCNGCAHIYERRSLLRLKGGVPDTLKYLATAVACLVVIAATEKECAACVNKCACKSWCENCPRGPSYRPRQLCCKWDTRFFRGCDGQLVSRWLLGQFRNVALYKKLLTITAFRHSSLEVPPLWTRLYVRVIARTVEVRC